MNKKGFTFIELLVVMVFLGLITLFAFPVVTGILKQSEDNKYNAFLSDVFLATEAYIQKNIDKYPQLQDEDGIAYVYMSELVSSKFLRSTLVNPNYCDKDNNCYPKKISTCDELGENCLIDDYTVTVIKKETGLYSYNLVSRIISN